MILTFINCHRITNSFLDHNNDPPSPYHKLIDPYNDPPSPCHQLSSTLAAGRHFHISGCKSQQQPENVVSIPGNVHCVVLSRRLLLDSVHCYGTQGGGTGNRELKQTTVSFTRIHLFEQLYISIPKCDFIYANNVLYNYTRANYYFLIENTVLYNKLQFNSQTYICITKFFVLIT